MKLYGRDNLIKRLEAKSIIFGIHKLWIGHIRPSGYGTIKLYKKEIKVHRLSAYLFHNFDLNNQDLQVNHKVTCPYKNCWSPDCIYVGSHIDNMLDRRVVNTHCPRGHEYTIQGRASKRSRKRCLVCNRMQEQNLLIKKRLTEKTNLSKDKEHASCINS